jgi:hypothetical protein
MRSSRSEKHAKQHYIEENSDVDLDEDIHNRNLSQVSIEKIAQEEAQCERKALGNKES